MTNEKFIGFTMEKTKHIALVAHDGKKKELVMLIIPILSRSSFPFTQKGVVRQHRPECS